jgi:hypothetical protein
MAKASFFALRETAERKAGKKLLAKIDLPRNGHHAPLYIGLHSITLINDAVGASAASRFLADSCHCNGALVSPA